MVTGEGVGFSTGLGRALKYIHVRTVMLDHIKVHCCEILYGTTKVSGNGKCLQENLGQDYSAPEIYNHSAVPQIGELTRKNAEIK
jgi:hypothetical protein